MISMTTLTSLRAEPVRLVAAARVIIYMLTTFGLLQWTDVQADAVLMVVGFVLVPLVEFLSSILVRRNVTSDKTLHAAGTDRQEMKEVADTPGLVMRPQVLQGYEEKPPDV